MAHIWNPSSQEAGDEDWKCEASLGYISSPCLRKPRAGLWFSGRAVLLACTGAWVVPREKEWILEVQTREARKTQERGKGEGSMSARMDPGLGRPVLRLISTPPLTTALRSFWFCCWKFYYETVHMPPSAKSHVDTRMSFQSGHTHVDSTVL